MKTFKILISLGVLISFGSLSGYALFHFTNSNQSIDSFLTLEEFDSFKMHTVTFDALGLKWESGLTERTISVRNGKTISFDQIPPNPNGEFLDDIFESWTIDGVEPFDFETSIEDSILLFPIYQQQIITFEEITYVFHPVQEEIAVVTSEEDIVIANIRDHFDGFKVTRVLSGAFMQRYNLEEVNFGDNIELIDNIAFYQSFNIEGNLAFPSALSAIGSEAFAHCYGITSISFNDNIRTLGSGSFLGAIGLGFGQTIVLPSSIEYIDADAFASIADLNIDVSRVLEENLINFDSSWSGSANIIKN